MRYFNHTTFLLISGLFLFLWGSAHAVSLAEITATSFGGSDVVTVRYTITGVDPGNVEGSLTGTVTFEKGDKSKDILLKIKDDLKLDKDKNIIFSVDELPASVTLGGNNKSISITIVDDKTTKPKNTPPTASDKTITIKENTSYDFKEEDFGLSDTDDGDTVRIRIVSLPSKGKLEGYDVARAGVGPLRVDQILMSHELRHMSFTPAKNETGTGYASFQFKAYDGIADAAAPNTITFDITTADTSFVAKQKESKPLQIEFNNESITQAEGTAGNSEYRFTVRLVNGPSTEVVKALYTVEGTGTNPADKDDFVDGKLPEDTLTIPAGEEGNAITIKVKGDTDKEKTEEFTITLSNPSPGVEIVENGKSSKGIIQDGNGVGSSSQSFITQNACDANPCQNSGACSDLENGYRCDCPLGFSGDVCQTKVFTLVAGSRTVLLTNSILRSGSSLTTPESVVTSFEEARRTTTTTTTTTPTTTPAAPPEICGNFVDDDLDGLVDFADVADCTATADETAFCFDGLDNDNDGLPDIFDSDCIPEICGNFVDDDGDGDTDFADAECTATADETAFCFDGLDNDNDGDVDGADSDCATSTPLTLVLPLLNDIDGDDIVIVVDGGDNLSTVRSTDADLVTNSLFLVQFTGFGMAIAVPRTGVTANGAVTLFDGPNPLEFTRGATIYEINIGVTITSPTDITVDALSGNNCGAGPC